MKIDDITNAVLILVRLGVTARFIFCMVKLIGAEEEAVKYKKRAKNAVLFWIIAECVWIIKDLIIFYYSESHFSLPVTRSHRSLHMRKRLPDAGKKLLHRCTLGLFIKMGNTDGQEI